MRVRRLALLGVVAAALAAAAPAQAINDPTVPADTCSGDTPAVGNTPDGSNPGIAQSLQVAPAVSANNPGFSPIKGDVTSGAKGQVKSPADNAIDGICFNAR